MTKKEILQKKLVDSLAGQTLEMLNELWALTDKRKDDGVHTLRGYLMEEIERRLTDEEFEIWLEGA